MVTDEQYKALQRRIDELERKIKNVSIQMDALAMKESAKSFSSSHGRETVNKRDNTKYKFDGKIYCKRRIVLEIIKKYIADYSIDSYEQLSAVFPDYLQGSLGVIQRAEAAERYKAAGKRFYFSDEDVITLNGDCYVVCSQWDVKNISKFLEAAKKYYSIETMNY